MTSLWKAIPIKEYELIMAGREHPVESSSHDTSEHLLEFLPKKLQEKAGKLLKVINQNLDFQWKTSGEIISNGQEIPFSHLSDLLLLAVRPYPTRYNDVPGLEPFIKTIKSNNVPHALLGMPFIKLMESKENNGLKWVNFIKP